MDLLVTTSLLGTSGLMLYAGLSHAVQGEGLRRALAVVLGGARRRLLQIAQGAIAAAEISVGFASLAAYFLPLSKSSRVSLASGSALLLSSYLGYLLWLSKSKPHAPCGCLGSSDKPVNKPFILRTAVFAGVAWIGALGLAEAGNPSLPNMAMGVAMAAILFPLIQFATAAATLSTRGAQG